MPRISRAKAAKRHGTAVQLPSKRGFTVPDEQVVEQVNPDQPEASTSSTVEIGPSEVSFSKLKKGKAPATSIPSEALLGAHPYSRSHTRREKRKTKQEIAGGLGAISLALAETVGEVVVPPEPKATLSKQQVREKKVVEARKVEEEADKGKIGQGKKRTMNESGRRKQIALEAKRIPAVMKHPAYKDNPWATIRLHASNSIATKPLPGAGKPAGRTKLGPADGMDVE